MTHDDHSIHAISADAFGRAQEAELSRWSQLSSDTANALYELTEHSEIQGPLRQIAGRTRFDRGLEVGIGPYSLGFLAVHMADLVGTIDGLDPLPRLDLKLVDPEVQARFDLIRSRVTYTQGAAECMAFPDCAYDIVSCINVVDHAREPAAILREIERVLRPGGLLVFGVSTLSLAGEWKWRLARSLHPDRWLYVAHPHTFQWTRARELVKTVAESVLWENRPSVIQQAIGHGRMSFWIVRKLTR